MKIALCFIISYEHILNKEEIWREWIDYNKDIINVYFYYKDITKIKSQWILDHCLPPNDCVYKTSYYHVIPAYLSLMKYAFQHDNGSNQWFCFLTDSCCPIISPRRFRYLFYTNREKSIFSWKKAWWNPTFHKRANLALLPEEFRLANDPWFVLKREDIQVSLQYIQQKATILKTICDGGLANESLFAIILFSCGKLDSVINKASHAADWSRMASSTSPHIFKSADVKDTQFIENTLLKNDCTMFIRKIAPEFPNDTLKHYIYEYSRETDDKLVIVIPNTLSFMHYLIGLLIVVYWGICFYYLDVYKYQSV
jgi:hypothetical protein